MEAHKLRARLAKYFDTEGKSDPVRVELPVGRYLPVFGTGAALSRQAAPAYRTPSRERLAFRIAVLPFDNRSPGARDHFFADGLTDELNHALAGIRELDVVSRTSAFQFKGRQIDVRELAARLDADAVIEGSVRRFGDHLRILVQVDDGADGRTVGSQTYDRKRTSSFGAQQEIASAISEDLALQIYGTCSARRVLPIIAALLLCVIPAPTRIICRAFFAGTATRWRTSRRPLDASSEPSRATSTLPGLIRI